MKNRSVPNMRTLMEAVLNEAQQYEGMFDKMIRVFAEDSPDYLSDIEKIQKLVSDTIKDAKTQLRKSDRIVWFLKIVRVAIANYLYNIDNGLGIEKLNRSYIDRYELETGTPWKAIHIDELKETLFHFMSLPIHEIQNYQFRNQTPSEVFSAFKEWEDEWKKEASGSVTLRSGDDIILDFQTGWVWMLLPRAACSAEAEAMGHCGNEPRSGTDDRILSLRKKIGSLDETEKWSPHLTFILNSEGQLTEMKGRGNDKPVEKYHSMIVELLKLPMIKGIDGGGYLPENNFSISDLDESLIVQLGKAKPMLLNSFWYKAVVGKDEHFYTKLQDEVSDMFREGIYDIADDKVVMAIWPSRDEVVRKAYFEGDAADVENMFNWDWSKIPILEDAENTRWALDKEAAFDGYDLDAFFSNTDRIEAALKFLRRYVERQAGDYLVDYVTNLPYKLGLLSFERTKSGGLMMYFDANEASRWADIFQRGGGEGHEYEYYDLKACYSDYMLMDEHFDSEHMDYPPANFITNINERVLSFWLKAVKKHALDSKQLKFNF